MSLRSNQLKTAQNGTKTISNRKTTQPFDASYKNDSLRYKNNDREKLRKK